MTTTSTPPRVRRLSWNGWTLDPDLLTLDLLNHVGGHRYQIDLEKCMTSAQTLDWIAQVAGKSWATDAILAGLVRAMNDVLRPQANLCSFGQDRTITDVRVLVERVINRGRP